MSTNNQDQDKDSKAKFTKSALEWRRSLVLSKLSKGWSQADIARELKLHPSTISLDVQYLKERKRESLRTHLQQELPFEHARAMTGINDLLRKANEILDNTKDPKLQLQTINVLANLYAGILTMASDGNIIQQAMEKVELLEDIKRGKFENSNSEEQATDDDDIIESEEDIPTEPEEDLKEEE
jgi:predicted transcriptional regulator